MNPSRLYFSLALCAGLLLGCAEETPSITEEAAITSDSYSYPIVDSNQTTCYKSSTGAVKNCNKAGQDGTTLGNSPSYDASSTTVTDQVTGLTWTLSTDLNGDGSTDYSDKKTQSEAKIYCKSLSLGGYKDWRLPNIKTLYSLILFSGKDATSYTGSDTSTLTPFLHRKFDWAFGDTSAGDRIIDAQYASSTSYVSVTNANDATTFGVNFVDGRIKGYPTATKYFYVRCVRGNSSYGENDFTDNGDNTISDLATGLMWQQQDSQSTNFDNAVAGCAKASTGGHGDWRLPNAKELQSIVDYTRSPDTSSSAAIDKVFDATSFTNEEGYTDWGYYWTSTTHVDNNDDALSAVYIAFGRALGYVNSTILDVHGAGAQRSNYKTGVAATTGASSATGSDGSTFYYKGPQGDILREDNFYRCVRDL